jgi:chromosome segregation ATPase
MELGKWLIGSAGVLLVGLGVSLGAQGARTPDPDVLSALLTEVRGLRQAMEQMASAGPRVQLALGRLQLQEQRVNTLIRRLESIRDSVTSAGEQAAAQEAQLAGFEKMFKDQPPDENNPLRHMMDGLRKAIAASGTEVQRLQAEEAQLQQQIAAEQGRWSEINRTLEDLERALGKR